MIIALDLLKLIVDGLNDKVLVNVDKIAPKLIEVIDVCLEADPTPNPSSSSSSSSS